MINTLFNSEALRKLKEIPSDSVDLIVTSPPYDKVRDYKGYTFDFENIAQHLSYILKPGGVICWNVNDGMEDGSETLTSFKQALYFKEELGLKVFDTMIYQKKNFSHPEKNKYHQVFEYVFCISKGKHKTFNPIIDRKNLTAGAVGNLGVNTFTEKDGSKSVRAKKVTAEYGKRHNVWLGNTRGQEDMCVKLKHPALMPKWLASDLIKSFSNEGDLVLDPLAGQGTTLWEAKKLNRNFVGIEVSKEYCELAKEEYNRLFEGELSVIKDE